MKAEEDMRWESRPKTPSRADELQQYCENLEKRIEDLETELMDATSRIESMEATIGEL